MISFETMLIFIPASILLILSPGPDILFVITQGIMSGKKAGFTTALGLAAGNIVHTVLAVFGIAVIFKNSMLAFTIFKIFGACYLVYLSLKILLHFNEGITVEKKGDVKKQNLFIRGFVMNALNPKVALFYLAFLPQFIIYNEGNASLQFLQLGLIFITLVVLIFGAVGLSAGTIGDLLTRRPGFSKFINGFSIVIFLLIALKIILMRQ